MTISEIKEKLTPIFIEKKIKKATLFGSYAKEKANENSDIDLVIDTEITGFSFFALRSEMEDLINREIDLIANFEIIPQSRIDDEVKRTGVVIYEI